MLDSNYLIINRKAQKFANIKMAGHTAVFLDEEGSMLDHGTLTLDDSIYTALYCDDVRNVTFVVNKAGIQTVVTVLWFTDAGYAEGRTAIKSALGISMSRQNLRINRYAEAIAEKLAIGVELNVTDAVDESDMVKCPECGVLCPKGVEYCYDCGAELD